MCKKILFKYFVYFFIIFLFLFILVNIILDPYREYNLYNNKLNETKFIQNLLSVNSLYKKLKNDKSTLVFGTSRSRKINSDNINDNILNFYPIYGNPKAVYKFLLQLNEIQIKNINSIYYLLDYHVFKDNQYTLDIDFSSEKSKFKYLFTHFNTTKIVDSFDLVYKNISKNFDKYIHENGYVAYVKEETSLSKELLLLDINRKDKLAHKKEQEFDLDSFKYLGKIQEFVKKYNIKIVYYTPTFMSEYIERMDKKLYFELRKNYLEYIEEFHELTYIEGISNNYNSFTDPTHLTQDATDKSINELNTNKYIINRNNFNSKIKSLNKVLEKME